MRNLASQTVVWFLMVIGTVLPSQARVYYVDNASTCDLSCGSSWSAAFATLEVAIYGSHAGDEIWVKKGSYTSSAYIAIDKDIVVYGGFAGNESRLAQRDPEKNISRIRVDSASKCFLLKNEAEIEGLYITMGSQVRNGVVVEDGSIAAVRNCVIQGNDYVSGSCISVENGGTAEIVDCRIYGNVAGNRGAGILVEELSTVAVNGCRIYGNVSLADGGGVFVESSDVNLTNCSIYGNVAEGGGGGIALHKADVTLTGCSIYDNSAYDGGGIAADDMDRLRVMECSLYGNRASEYGGGIYTDFTYARVSSSACYANTAAYGGGIYTYAGELSLLNCRLYENAAAENGGGVLAEAADEHTLTSCLLYRNEARNGGGLYSLSDRVVIANCTLHSNAAISGGAAYFVDGDVVVLNTIVWDNGGDQLSSFADSMSVSFSDVQGDHVGVGNIDADPLFAGDGDYHLTALSPCIDAGTSESTPPTDIDGTVRYDDASAANTGGGSEPYYDIGAYEYDGADISTAVTTILPDLATTTTTLFPADNETTSSTTTSASSATTSIADNATTTTTTVASTTTTARSFCPAVALYGACAGEVTLLRQFRDVVLRESPYGIAMVAQYRHARPVMCAALEASPGARRLVKQAVDKMLPLISVAVQYYQGLHAQAL
ncbi:right-handed parallel beta-helix repeat-containing protein [Thermodesulfobacteriota bacterium]